MNHLKIYQLTTLFLLFFLISGVILHSDSGVDETRVVNHFKLKMKISSNVPPNSTHPADFEAVSDTAELYQINWTLMDDNYSLPFIQNYTIDYSKVIGLGTENEHYEFNFTTTQYSNETASFLNETGSINPVIYDIFRIKYKDLAKNSYYLEKELYKIRYNNKTLELWPYYIGVEDVNPITRVNQIKNFSLIFNPLDLYRVWKRRNNEDYSILVDWKIWNNSASILINVDTSITGTFYYKLEIVDNTLQEGLSDIIQVIVSESEENEPSGDEQVRDISFGVWFFIGIGVSIIFLIICRKPANKKIGKSDKTK